MRPSSPARSGTDASCCSSSTFVSSVRCLRFGREVRRSRERQSYTALRRSGAARRVQHIRLRARGLAASHLIVRISAGRAPAPGRLRHGKRSPGAPRRSASAPRVVRRSALCDRGLRREVHDRASSQPSSRRRSDASITASPVERERVVAGVRSAAMAYRRQAEPRCRQEGVPVAFGGRRDAPGDPVAGVRIDAELDPPPAAHLRRSGSPSRVRPGPAGTGCRCG